MSDSFENRVLRRILGPKRDGVMGEWRKLHTYIHTYIPTNIHTYLYNEELLN
jgi:hypothetical protein